jgi:uncharacterized protein
VTTAGLTAFARHAGCSQDELGIRAADAAAGLRLGLAAAAVAIGGVALGASLPATRPLFQDRRVTAVGRREAVYHLAVRIPLATALAEELAFRDALLGLVRRRRSPRRRRGMDLAALRRLACPPDPQGLRWQSSQRPGCRSPPGAANRSAGNDVVDRRGRQPVAWLRLRSRSLLAPILAHAATNVSAYPAGRWVVRRTSQELGGRGG